jgi:hypothetical protein
LSQRDSQTPDATGPAAGRVTPQAGGLDARDVS